MAVSTGTAILGAAGIGAAAGLLGGNRRAGTVNTAGTASTDPWWAVQPYLQDAFARGEGLLGQPAIGAQSPYTSAAALQQAQLAQDPNSLIGQSQGELGRTISGGYLTPGGNPYLDAAAQQAINRATQSVSSRFSGDNFGSSPNQEWMTRAATEAASPFYFGAYQQERQNQLNALQQAPGLQFANIPQLYQAGQTEEARAQAEVDAPWAQLARYRGLLTGVPGGTTTSQQQQPYFTNPYASALGGGLLGMQLYNAWPQQQPQGYNDFMGNAWQSGFGPAFTQSGIYG